MIKLFRDQNDYVLQNSDRAIRLSHFSIDELFQSDDPASFLNEAFEKIAGEEASYPFDEKAAVDTAWLPPINHQEVWAAGVTYFKSRSARMEESEQSGGDRFYDLVYEAERPELFFKATAARTRGHRADVRIREDSSWDVPEPELTLAIGSNGKIFGYTIGNDMSSRSIEGENPLYLPQAKIYQGSCAIGPCLVVGDMISAESTIAISIFRDNKVVFEGSTAVSQIKRSFDELSSFLFRENEFPCGVYLMTGTGIVPENDFSLASGDRIEIQIESLGTLINTVA